MKSVTIPPRLLRFFEQISPVVLAIFIPSVLLRAWAFDRAHVFNTSLNEQMLWDSAPSLIAIDLITALIFGLALWPLVRASQSKKRVLSALAIAAQAIICIVALITLAVQYRVYRELGFYPNWNSFRHFAGPESPFVGTVKSYLDWQNIVFLLVLVVAPVIVLLGARYFSSRVAVITMCVTALLPVAYFWPCAPAAAALRTHPFINLPPYLYDQPTQNDPEVSRDPPSLKSICGLTQRDACRAMFPPRQKPSFVVVLLESTGDQYLHDGDHWKFPNFSRVASASVRFPWYYSPAGTSNPSVFSLVSSRHAIPSDEWWETHEVRAEHTLTSALHNAGYATAMFMSGCRRFFFDGPLFNSMPWDAFLDGDDIAKVDNAPREKREQNSGVVDDRNTVEHVISFCKQNLAKDKPFFSIFYTGVPHMPYAYLSRGPHAIHPDPKNSFEKYENQLAYVDGVLGHLYDELLASGFFKNGYLIVTGDHGQAFGQHGGFGHGTQVYDEVQRVPMLFVNPILLKPGICRTSGSHIDFAPTILDLAGIAPLDRMEGTSLLSDSSSAMIFIGAAHDKVKLGVVDFPYKAIYLTGDKRTELYRLDRDPLEKEDLATKEPDLAQKYRSWIKSYVFHYLTPGYMRNPLPAHQAFFEGRRAMNNGHSPSAAMPYLREALRLQPDFAEAKHLLAECFYRMGLDRAGLGVWDQALDQFKEAVRLDPGHVEAQLALCDLYTATGKPAEAAAAIKAARDQAAYDRSLILREAWRLAATRQDPAMARKLLTVIPESDGTQTTIEVFAMVAAANGDFEKAVELQQKALSDYERLRYWGSPPADRMQERLKFYQKGEMPPELPYPGSRMTRLPQPQDRSKAG